MIRPTRMPTAPSHDNHHDRLELRVLIRRMQLLAGLVSVVAACSAPIPAATFGNPVGAPARDILSPSVTSPTPSMESAAPTLAAPSWIAPDLDPAFAEGLASLAWTVGGNGRPVPSCPRSPAGRRDPGDSARSRGIGVLRPIPAWIGGFRAAIERDRAGSSVARRRIRPEWASYPWIDWCHRNRSSQRMAVAA